MGKNSILKVFMREWYQDILRPLGNMKIHYRTHKSSPLERILGPDESIPHTHTLLPYDPF
jgi:hypothetical protein